MPFDTFDPTDNLPAVEAKLDGNAAKAQALLTAAGVAEGATSIGSTTEGGDAIANSDTLLQRIQKNGGRIETLENAGGGSEVSQDLGVDFDLTTIAADIKGSTSIDGAIASQYPDGTGLYQVEAIASVAVVGTSFVDGDAIAIIVSKRDSAGVQRRWAAASTAAGEAPVWKELGGPVTTSQIVDRNVTRIKLSLDALAPEQRTLSLPTDGTEAGTMVGGAFAAMPMQQGNSFAMTRTPLVAWQDLAPLAAGQVDYFVDGLLGDDANTGTASSAPKKTLEAALSQTDLGTCWVAPGLYGFLGGWSGAENNPSIADVALGLDDSYAVRRWDNGRPGDVIVSTHLATSSTYTQVGVTNVYTMTNPDCVAVVDPSLRTSTGAYVKYTQLDFGSDALNEPACDATDKTWYITEAGTVAVHKAGGGQPSRNELILCFDTDNVKEESRRNIYCERINFVGGNDALTIGREAGAVGNSGRIFFEGCNFYSSNGAGVKVTRWALAYAAHSNAHGNGLDGFQAFGVDNSPSLSLGGDFITFDCHADDNGHGTPASGSDNINGYSNHYGMRGLHVHSTGKGNKGPQFADITDTQTWWVRCTAGVSSVSTGGASQSSLAVLGASAKGWAYRCEAPNYFASTGSFAGYDQSLFGTVDGDASTYVQA